MEATFPPLEDIVASFDGECDVASKCPTHVSGGGPNGSYSAKWVYGANPEKLVTYVGNLNLHWRNQFTIMFDFKGAELTSTMTLLFRQNQFTIGGRFAGGLLFTLTSAGIFGDNDVYIDNTYASETVWHNVAFTIKPGIGGRIKGYIDGVLNATSSQTSGTLALNTAQRIMTSDDPDGFGGEIDNLQFFDIALTASEVAAIAGVDL